MKLNVNFFRRYVWLLLLFALLPVLGMLWVRQQSSTRHTSQAPPASPSPTVTAPSPLPSSPIPIQTSPSPPAPKPKSTGGKPALTKEQEAMNRRAKASFEISAAPVDSVIEMHVAIAQGLPSLTIRTSTNADLLSEKGKRLGQLPAQTSYTAQIDGSSISLGASQLPDVVLIDPGFNGLVSVGDRTYRGRMLLVAHNGGLWAVNYVNLRQYLHSVVASEVSPSWPMDALKAQAIAARSYALVYYFKPVSSFYHLGSDEYYQVYSGIDREAEETREAVDGTSGEFVSYRGGVVESLYAASDDIVAEAFEGKGMSQLGALGLSEQGYTYKQILSHYYPGTGVSRIVLDQE